MGGHTFGREAPFATTSFEEGEWALIFEGGPIFKRFTVPISYNCDVKHSELHRAQMLYITVARVWK